MFLEESEILLSEYTYKAYLENANSLKNNISKIINKCVENMNKCKSNEKLYRKNCIKLQKKASQLRKLYDEGNYFYFCSILANNNKDLIKSNLISLIPYVGSAYILINLQRSDVNINKIAHSMQGKEISRKFVIEYEKLAKRYKI